MKELIIFIRNRILCNKNNVFEKTINIFEKNRESLSYN